MRLALTCKQSLFYLTVFPFFLSLTPVLHVVSARYTVYNRDGFITRYSKNPHANVNQDLSTRGSGFHVRFVACVSYMGACTSYTASVPSPTSVPKRTIPTSIPPSPTSTSSPSSYQTSSSVPTITTLYTQSSSSPTSSWTSTSSSSLAFSSPIPVAPTPQAQPAPPLAAGTSTGITSLSLTSSSAISAVYSSTSTFTSISMSISTSTSTSTLGGTSTSTWDGTSTGTLISTSAGTSTNASISASTSTSLNTPSSDKDTSNVRAIVGGAVGGATTLVALTIALLCYRQRQKHKSASSPLSDAGPASSPFSHNASPENLSCLKQPVTPTSSILESPAASYPGLPHNLEHEDTSSSDVSRPPSSLIFAGHMGEAQRLDSQGNGGDGEHASQRADMIRRGFSSFSDLLAAQQHAIVAETLERRDTGLTPPSLAGNSERESSAERANGATRPLLPILPLPADDKSAESASHTWDSSTSFAVPLLSGGDMDLINSLHQTGVPGSIIAQIFERILAALPLRAQACATGTVQTEYRSSKADTVSTVPPSYRTQLPSA